MMKHRIIWGSIAVLLIGGSLGYWLIRRRRAELRVDLKQTIESTYANLASRVAAAEQLWDLDEDGDAVLPTLIDGLGSGEIHVKDSAAITLGRMGPVAKKAIPALIESARSPGFVVGPVKIDDRWRKFGNYHTAAIFEIGLEPSTREDLLAAIDEARNGSREIERVGYFELLSTYDADPLVAIPRYLRAIEEEDSAGMVAANEYLMRLGPSAASGLELIVEGLSSDSANVRKWCVAAIIKLGPKAPPALPQLARAVNDKDADVGRLAIFALGMIGKRGIAILREIDLANHVELQDAVDWAIVQDHTEQALSFEGLPILTARTVSSIENSNDGWDLIHELTDAMRSGPMERSARAIRKCIALVPDQRVDPGVRDALMSNLGGGSRGSVTGVYESHLDGIRRLHRPELHQLQLAGIAALSDRCVYAHTLLRGMGEDASLAVPALVVASEFDPTFLGRRAASTLDFILPFLGPDPPEAYTTSWMYERTYQELFQAMLLRDMYPVKVEGREFGGADLFQAKYARVPANHSFVTHHGLSDKQYEDRSLKHSSAGYEEIWHQAFVGVSGETRHCTVWEKSQSISEALKSEKPVGQ